MVSYILFIFICLDFIHDCIMIVWLIDMQSNRAKEIHQAAVAGDKAALSRLLSDATADDFKYEEEVQCI